MLGCSSFFKRSISYCKCTFFSSLKLLILIYLIATSYPVVKLRPLNTFPQAPRPTTSPIYYQLYYLTNSLTYGPTILGCLFSPIDTCLTTFCAGFDLDITLVYTSDATAAAAPTPPFIFCLNL